MAHVQIFLSTVSAEFRSYRETLRHSLDRPNLTVKVQEDFIVTGTETLDMLDQYIRACDVVVHLVGDMTGAAAQAPSVAVIRERYLDFADRLPVGDCLQAGGPALSYTQWEAWLALYHRRKLIIAAPQPGAKRDPAYVLDPAQQAAQQAHLARLARVERYPGFQFSNPEHFAAEIWRSGLLDVLVEAGLIKKPIHLRYASLGELFKGRERLLEELAQRFGPVPQRSGAPLAPKVLTGLGGVGKTRLAVEYALRRADAYSALLLLGADSPESLRRNLAALCGAAMLDLPQQSEADETRQRDAALAWLQRHPGWLLILDNVDNPAAAAAARALLPHLSGGHLLLTSRLANWPAAMATLEVDVLAPDDAADFLLVRTDGKRRRSPDDGEVARELAQELGYLALALEQAGAYIACRTASFRQYLAEWQSRRAQVLAWYDPSVMDYPASVAITWQASFDQLSERARALLQRLAWLAPEPIPESLLEVPVGEADPAAAFDTLAELKAFSLVTSSTEAPVFSVHRLVQEVTRRVQGEETNRLVEALQWVNAAFDGDPMDVRDWPVLDPLAPHVRAIAGYADEAGIPAPTARLHSDLGVLLYHKSLYAKAEPLIRRALAIDEASFGADHHYVAIRLSNLAQLLQATNRLNEAEPLMRRALAIEEVSFGADHSNVAVAVNNLAKLLEATNRLADAEPLMRRALTIDELCLGVDHPNVAIRLHNLAAVLRAMDRVAEAEPLMRRALEIDDRIFGADHHRVARGLSNLAVMLQETNRRVEAKSLMRRALAIDEASFGTDHPNVARDLNNLGRLLKETNRFAEAEPLLRRAVAIVEEFLGPNHPKLATALSNLGQFLGSTSRLDEAEPLLRRALRIAVTCSGIEHPFSNAMGDNYVLLLRAMGITDEEIRAELAALLAGA
jgi:tetratricopeptide (TPR) repeat protein